MRQTSPTCGVVGTAGLPCFLPEGHSGKHRSCKVLEWSGSEHVRPEFQAIVSGWTLIDGLDDLTEKIERAAKWTEKNGPLLPGEEAIVQLMIQTQIARVIEMGGLPIYED